MQKGKALMWKYIQAKAKVGEEKKDSFIENLKSFFMTPKKFALGGAVAAILILALVVTTNFGNWFSGKPQTVFATFEMTADEEDGSGVAADSSFTLKASEDYSAGRIAENIKVTPEVEIEVDKTGDGKYKITPKQSLETGTIYNFSIISGDNTEYSWSYQVQDTFKVSGTLPGDKSTHVPVNSGIEIYLSHENFDFKNAEDYFEISPKVKGKFEKNRKTLIFVPSGGLREATIYTVTLKKGLKLLDSDKSLDSDLVFAFETEKTVDAYRSGFQFTRANYEAAVKSPIALQAYTYSLKEKGISELDVEIFQYKSQEDFMKDLQNRLDLPGWCYFTKEFFTYDTGQLTEMGSFKAQIGSNYTGHIYLPDLELDKGYYLFQVKSENPNLPPTQALVQITDVSAYLNISQTDSLIWANDVSTGKPIKNAKIEIGGLNKSYETNEEGVARFATPEQWKNVYEERKSNFIKITAEDNKALILEVMPYFDSANFPNYWFSFATDRPVYKLTDKIKYFGFIQPKNGMGKMEDLKIRMEYGYQNYVSEVSLNGQKDGTFIGEIGLENYKPGYYNLTILSGETVINSHYFEIADYTKPAYDLKIEADKKAIFSGEKVNIKMSANFFDGTAVPNLEVKYNNSDQQKTLYTSDDGEINMSETPQGNKCSFENIESYYCSDISYKYFEVNATLAEEMDLWDSVDLRVFNSHVAIYGESNVENGKGKVEMEANKIDLSKINQEENSDYFSYLGDGAPGTEISGKVVEIEWIKTETGEYYDFINKKTQKTYSYDDKLTLMDEFKVVTDADGKAAYEFDVAEDKSYRILLEAKDAQGNTAHEVVYLYGAENRYSDYNYYQIKLLSGDENNLVDVGDEVEVGFANNDTVMKAKEGDQFLFMQLSNGLQEYGLTNSTHYSFEFEKEDVPNVNILGVWFDGKTYQTTYGTDVKYNQELERLEIEVQANKEKYQPGDKVTIDVRVKDQNGSPAAAKVNLNLVDEAYYKAVYDNFSDPLQDLYTNNPSGVLTQYDSHQNPIDSEGDGGKGGCFTAETRILMADGGYKAIKNIKKGDMILTRKHAYSLELVPGEVTNTISHEVSEYLVINEDLEVTQEHVVFVNGKWDIAGNVKIGDNLQNKKGEEIKVKSIRKVFEPVMVYNFEVKDQHTYFANNFYVHNDKGGDGVRSDFEDTALFEVVEVGKNGQGQITFQLPDNITSWRVTARAIDGENLRAGYGSGAVVVSLPFFTDVVMNDEYSVKDKPMIKMRAYGDELKKDETVKFNVSAKSLGLEKSEELSAKAFQAAYFALPQLKIGDHEVVVKANTGGKEDALAKKTKIKGSRLKKDHFELIRKVDDKTVFDLAKEGPTEIKFMDGGMAYYYPNLMNLHYTNGDRLDQRLSAIIAAELLKKYFGEERFAYSEDITSNYQPGGLKLLPYGEADLNLTALALAVESNPGRYDKEGLKQYLYAIYKDKEANLNEVVLSLLGLSSLHEPVLLSLREIQKEEKLSVEDKLNLALAFSNLGSKTEAKKIYEEEFDQLAEGPESVYRTALGAVVAAAIGEAQQADKLWEFVEKIGFEKELSNLYELGYVKNVLDHANPDALEFRVKVNEHSEGVELDKWQDYGVMAYDGDLVAVSVSKGDLAAVVYSAETVEPGDFDGYDGLSVKRSYSVNGKVTDTFKEGDLVQVTLMPSFTGRLKDPSFEITDILPSGLTPVTAPRSFSNYNYEIRFPYNVNGQELSFYWSSAQAQFGPPVLAIKYYARVVNAGEFYGDPAKIQSYADEEIVSISEPAWVKIEAK